MVGTAYSVDNVFHFPFFFAFDTSEKLPKNVKLRNTIINESKIWVRVQFLIVHLNGKLPICFK